MADIVLKNNRLKIVISEPGTRYRRQRFDWCGIVSEAVLDGRHSFLSQEPAFYGQITGGFGLSSNFEAANQFEYGNTPVGDYFPRVGVGRIVRHDRSPFSMYHDYAIDPAPMSFKVEGEDTVVFHTGAVACNGYAFEIEKTIRLKENTIETEYAIANVGEKSVVFEESNHNYTVINNMRIDENYQMSVPYNLKVKIGRGGVNVGYNTLNVTAYQDFFIFDVEGFDGCLPHFWKVTHLPSGIGYAETVSAPVSRFFVWGCHNNFCPIVYVRAMSVPGQTNRWVRRMSFFD